MDADDVAHPERLRLQVSAFDSQPGVDVVSCWVKHFPDEAVAEGFRVYEEWLNSLVSHELMMRDRFIDGWNVTQIAQKYGLSPGAVRMRVLRSIEQLRQILDREHSGERQTWRSALLPLVGGAFPDISKSCRDGQKGPSTDSAPIPRDIRAVSATLGVDQ